MYEITDTQVSYHRGELAAEARIEAVLPAGPGRWAVVTDVTPFHPVDAAWPDQPADHGTLTIGDQVTPVVDTQILTFRQADGAVAIGSGVTARRGDTEHVFAVAHLIVKQPEDDWVGETVSLEVDAHRRRWLSAAHTGCHLVAYAFNQATDELWTKDAPVDSRGSRNFDAAALIDSRHDLGSSVDRYRLGKSLRRKGFDHARMLADLDTYLARANDLLASWVAADAPVHLTGTSDRFTAERIWRCEISPVATMPCGGTHVSSLGQLRSIEIRAEFLEPEKELRLIAASPPR